MSNSVSSVEGSDEKVHHFPDRSIRRLLQYPEFVRYLVALLAPELLGYLDFDRGVHQNRSFLSATLRQREADVLLRVPFQGSASDEGVHICILIEHQSSIEALMRLRMLIYMGRLWESEYQQLDARTEGEQRWSPILPIVFYTGSDRWTEPRVLTEILNVPQALAPFVPTFKILFLDVKRMAGETLTESGHPFGWLLRVLQEEHADETAFRQALEVAVSEISRLRGTEDTYLREALNYLILLIFHRRSEDERDAFIDIVKEKSRDETEVEIMAQTAAETLIEQGKEIGIEQGKEIGIEQGAKETTIESILLFLDTRFEANTAETLKPTLEAIDDLQRLKHLLREAMRTQSLEAFTRRLTDTRNVL